jgi:DsbC/DsbD-like thiol-disulfide interchange protein
MRYLTIVLLLLCVILIAASQGTETNRARVSLISEATDFNSPFYIGLQFIMEPEWYIYWKNPGDAGIPADAQWTLPDGFTVSELIYPTPQKFDSGGIVSYGFSDETVLLARVTPASGFTASSADTIRGKISWMVCKESCYLEEGTVLATFDKIDTDESGIQLIKERLPKPIEYLDLQINSATASRKGGRVSVRIPVRGNDISRIDDFYPYAYQNFVVTHADSELRDDGIEFTLTPYYQDAALTSVGGLIMVDGTGYEFSVPVTITQ